MKLIEGDIDKSVTMEEEILLHALDRDETITSFFKNLDSTSQ
jgi:hypothetical protein